MLSVILCFTLSSTKAFAAKDDISGTYFEKEMRQLIDAGILQGYGDGTYGPNDQVTRAQFTTFVVRALELPVGDTVDFSTGDLYKDVDPDQWYAAPIAAATAAGLINGYPDGRFGPKDNITRQDMAMIIVRAAEAKGVVSEEKALNFEDNNAIQPYAVEAVKKLIGLEIINGKGKDGKIYFAPKDMTTRGETAAVITRLLKVIEPPKQTDFEVATLTEGKDPVIHASFDTYSKAVSKASGSKVVLKGNKIVWINDGKATTNGFTILYNKPSLTDSGITYTTSGVDLEILDINEDSIKVKLADTTGYVDPMLVNLIPEGLIKGNSYYYVKNGDLYHHLYNSISGKEASFLYGTAPAFMSSGKKYYSTNGNTFYDDNDRKVGNAYQYFDRMPLYTKTNYTAEQLDAYIKSVYPDSPLVGYGKSFKKAEEKYGTNALYLMAHAIHESDWGRSKIAKDKNNLFGIGASDGDPYKNAYTYASIEEGILKAAETFIVPRYFKAGSFAYNGAHLGNKSSGMNVKYASDAYWGEKVSGHMYRADQYLSKKYNTAPEENAYDLAQTVSTSVNVRSKPSVSGSKLYQLPNKNTTVQVLKETNDKGTWYEVAPKNIDGDSHTNAYVYSHGYSSYGTSLEKLSIAE